MHLYFFSTEVECFFLLLFSKRVQILKTEYKYGQYCTPVSQPDCRYFFVLTIIKNTIQLKNEKYWSCLMIWLLICLAIKD